MQDLSIKFEGSPQKFGKAAYCDIFYTESKLYQNIIYKDLINFKDVWSYKSQVISLQSLKDSLVCKNFYQQMQKNQIIYSQNEYIKFLTQKNRQIIDNNIQRTKKIVFDHNKRIQDIIKQKQQELKVIQSQKEILQNRIEQLQHELNKNTAIVNNIEKQRQDTLRRNRQREKQAQTLQKKLKQKQQQSQIMQQQYKQLVSKLKQQRLQTELHFKKKMIQHSQQNNQQLNDLQRYFQKKLQTLQMEKLQESVASKQYLNKILKKHQLQHKQAKKILQQQQQLIETLKKQVQFQKQKSLSLLKDIQKQDEVLDKYQIYLKQSDQNVIKLKQLLLQCQTQLQKAKISLQKNSIDKQSILNRIKICQQQARMWRESYYLKQSRDLMQD